MSLNKPLCAMSLLRLGRTCSFAENGLPLRSRLRGARPNGAAVQARREARPAHTRSADRGSQGRGRRARARDPRAGASARTTAARRTRHRTDRRRRRDRRLVIPGSHPLRGSHRAPRRRRARPRLQRPDDPEPTQPRRRPPTQPSLHTVVLHRRQHDSTTQAHIERRVAEGKSRREATRPLKRYLARHLYRLLQHSEPLMT